MALCATMPASWGFTGSLVQNLRATPSHFGSEWFDCVSYLYGRRQQVRYAQVRAIFSMTSAGEGGATQQHQAVLLRKFAKARLAGDILEEQFGCTRVRWEPASSLYAVCPIAAIIKREYIVPDWSSGGQPSSFHVSAFKWDRRVADKLPWPQWAQQDSDDDEEDA